MYTKFDKMIGKVMRGVDRTHDQLVFHAEDGWKFTFKHYQDCCESVWIEDVCGDLEDLVGSEMIIAEESDNRREDRSYEVATWTFYNFATAKGSVTVRWCGTSNGYYSTSVSFHADSPAEDASKFEEGYDNLLHGNNAESVKVRKMNRYKVFMFAGMASVIDFDMMHGYKLVDSNGIISDLDWQLGRSVCNGQKIVCDVEADVIEVALKRAKKLAEKFNQRRYHVYFGSYKRVCGYDCFAANPEEAIRKAMVKFGPNWYEFGGKLARVIDVDDPASPITANKEWVNDRKVCLALPLWIQESQYILSALSRR